MANYKTHSVGKNEKGIPYAFQLEGYISSAAPYFKSAEGDKKAFLSVSMGIGCEVELLMALANGTYEKGATYGGGEFVDLHLFGERAEKFSPVLNKGRRVVVSGPIKMEPFTRKDGSAGQRLVVNVDNIVDGGSFKAGIAPTVGKDIAVSTLSYVSKDGVNRNISMACTVSGTVVGCRGLAQGASGTSYLSFGVKTGMSAAKIYDLANGTFSKDKVYDEKKTIINVAVFREVAERLSKIIGNGAIVVLSGPVETRNYNGDTSYQLRPRNDAITVLKYAESGDSADAPAAGSAAAAAAETAPEAGNFEPVEDEDDELPF